MRNFASASRRCMERCCGYSRAWRRRGAAPGLSGDNSGAVAPLKDDRKYGVENRDHAQCYGCDAEHAACDAGGKRANSTEQSSGDGDDCRDESEELMTMPGEVK